MVQDQRKPEAHNSCLTTAGAAASDREEKRRSSNSVKQFRHSFLKRRRQQEVCCCCTVAQLKGLSQSQAALWLLLLFSFHIFGLDEISEIFHPTFQPELCFICLSCTSRCVFSYDGLLLQDRPLQVSLLPELCSHRQRHLEGRTQRAQN